MKGPRPVAPSSPTEPHTTGSSPLEPQTEGGKEEKMEEPVLGVTEDEEEEEEEANADKTVNPTKGSLHVCRREIINSH